MPYIMLSLINRKLLPYLEFAYKTPAEWRPERWGEYIKQEWQKEVEGGGWGMDRKDFEEGLKFSHSEFFFNSLVKMDKR